MKIENVEGVINDDERVFSLNQSAGMALYLSVAEYYKGKIQWFMRIKKGQKTLPFTIS